MAYIDWNDSFSVGIKEMDNQHKKLIELINQLHEAMRVGQGSSTVSSVISDLADYTVYHFQAEEKLLQTHNFPGYLVQLKSHKGFVEKVQEFQANLTSRKLSMSIEVIQFLKDWLIEHIQGQDMKYGKFLNEKGVQ